jgi:hypothetical protein
MLGIFKLLEDNHKYIFTEDTIRIIKKNKD